MRNRGIIPTKQQLRNNGPHGTPEGPLLFTSPRTSKPNSLDDSWTFHLHHVGNPIGRRLQLPNVPLYLKPSYISAKQWVFMDNIDKVIEPQYSFSAVVGRDMAINRKGHHLMLSPDASPEAYCSTAPIREDGRPTEQSLSRGQGEPMSAHTCCIKPGDGRSMWLWLLLAQNPAADTITRLPLLLCLAQNGCLEPQPLK